MDKTICELFAGVGGFRLGFERNSKDWKTVWFSQWEPGKKNQWAHDCYESHFGKSIDLSGDSEKTCQDISIVRKELIPDHTLLCAGFPCQDYSIAHSLSTSRGIEGKKGVLWWQIYDVLEKKRPKFCLFENVDRLLKSPAKQPGRDFGIMLWCLNHLGYSVEWRIVNSADYGSSQRRIRIFIFAFHNDTCLRKKYDLCSAIFIISKNGLFAKAFPVMKSIIKNHYDILYEDVFDVQEKFRLHFKNAGYMLDGKIYMADIFHLTSNQSCLGDVLQHNVDDSYFISDAEIEKFRYLKGSKKIYRTSKDGYSYMYSEGNMSFPDSLDLPSRTMLTSESTMNRSTHIILDPDVNKLRKLTPVEAERLNGFDDNWTLGMPESMRYFCMGNSLVVPLITRISDVLNNIIDDEM